MRNIFYAYILIIHSLLHRMFSIQISTVCDTTKFYFDVSLKECVSCPTNQVPNSTGNYT